MNAFEISFITSTMAFVTILPLLAALGRLEHGTAGPWRYRYRRMQTALVLLESLLAALIVYAILMLFVVRPY